MKAATKTPIRIEVARQDFLREATRNQSLAAVYSKAVHHWSHENDPEARVHLQRNAALHSKVAMWNLFAAIDLAAS